MRLSAPKLATCSDVENLERQEQRGRMMSGSATALPWNTAVADLQFLPHAQPFAVHTVAFGNATIIF
jgi:hypothetical protein